MFHVDDFIILDIIHPYTMVPNTNTYIRKFYVTHLLLNTRISCIFKNDASNLILIKAENDNSNLLIVNICIDGVLQTI